MGLKTVKYIEIDDVKGALYSGGKQSLLVPINFVEVLDSTFVHLVGREGADVLIYKIGESIGRGYAQALDSILKKEETIIDQETKIKVSSNAIFMEAGWGRIKIIKLDLAVNLLEVEITHSPSGSILENSDYSLEKGILAGIFRETTEKEVGCQLLEEDSKEHKIILSTTQEDSEELKKKEKIILLTRKNLEEMINQKTKELKDKVKELEKFQNLTVDRELRMIELKKETKELKEKLEKHKG